MVIALTPGARSVRRAGRPRLPWSTIGIAAGVLVVWQVAGQLDLVASGALPSPTRIAAAWWARRDDFPPHILGTVRVALTAFVLGNAVAIVIGVAGHLVPALERLTRITMVVLFCAPAVVVVPILGIALDGDWPKIAVAMLLVFFPTFVATRLGLEHAPGDAVAVVRASGGGALGQLRRVRLRAALPDVLAGLQIAAPACILGAMLGELLGGSPGLGIYLASSIGKGDSAVIWAIGLTATALAIALYGIIGLVRVAAGVERARPVVDLTASSRRHIASRTRRIAAWAAWGAGGIVVVLGLWYLAVWSTGLPQQLMNTPTDIVANLIASPTAADTRAALAPALIASLSSAAIGSVAGIGVALVLAVLLASFPRVSRAVFPLAFVSQSVPLLAFAPLIALLFGRGAVTTVVVVVTVTFFPSLVIILQGIATAPSGPVDVLRSVNAGRLTMLTRVILPNALPHVLVAARLAVPLALTGVVLAEQLITGQGLGGVLSISRGTLDYRMMWAVAAIVTVISVFVYTCILAVETLTLTRRS